MGYHVVGQSDGRSAAGRQSTGGQIADREDQHLPSDSDDSCDDVVTIARRHRPSEDER